MPEVLTTFIPSMLNANPRHFLPIVLSFVISIALGQDSSSNFYKTDSIFSFRSPKGYIPSLVHNFGEQITAPFHFTAKEWIITGSVIGVTALLVREDGQIHHWAVPLKQEHSWINSASPQVTKFGTSYGLITVCSFGVLSAIFKNEKGVQTSLLATQAMITSGVWTQLLKQITGRERPNNTYSSPSSGGGKWFGPLASFEGDLELQHPNSHFNSFPSGHTSLAFSIATVFATQYKDKPLIPIISYGAATLVGISRLTENRHWSSDVFAGAVLGYFCGRQVVRHFNDTHRNKSGSISSASLPKYNISFIQNGNQYGIAITW